MSGHTQSTRRERRAAELAARRSHPRSTSTGARRNGILRSPTVALTIVALVAGLGLVGGVAFISRPADTGGAVATPAISPVPVGLADGRSAGAASAPVMIDLWADFQCPSCGNFTETIEPRLRSTFIADGTVRLTYRDLAFLGRESTDAAIAARVSEAIGPGFWPFHDLLFANQAGENHGAFSRERLADMAVSLGMDRARFLAAFDDAAYGAAVRAETANGSAQGIDSTPTMVIDGVAYPGVPDWAALSALIERSASAP